MKIIQSISFDEDGVVVQYADSRDVRVRGQVVMQRLVRIERSHQDYSDDIEEIEHNTKRMLKNALEDWEESEPWVPPVEDDGDDDKGMGE